MSILGRHTMDDAFFAQVADVYIEACDAGDNPTDAVAGTWGVSRPTAGRWVSNARARGLLPPTTKGMQLKRSKKVIAVAAALGVDPDALERAVLQHAGGDLRVHSRGGDLEGRHQ